MCAYGFKAGQRAVTAPSTPRTDHNGDAVRFLFVEVHSNRSKRTVKTAFKVLYVPLYRWAAAAEV